MDELNLKISSSPHVRSSATTSDIMFDVLIALVPTTIVGLYNFGTHAAVLVALCIICCVGFEALFQWGMKKKITVLDFSAAVTGLLLALNLPPELPYWMAVVGCAFAIIIVKQLFGGLGQNFMNPALAARCFLLLSFTKQMTSFVYDGVTTATPLAVMKQGGSVDLKDMFLGFTGGTIGETSALALLVGALYLMIRRVISPKIPLVYIGTFAAAVAIYAAVKDLDVLNFTLEHICGGGLMLGAWFMATDYVTSPITSKGKIVYGVILGLLTFTLRIIGSGAEGVSYAIIISNILVPLIEKVTAPKAFGEGAELRDKNGKLKESVKETKKADKNAEEDTEKKEETSDKPKAKADAKGVMKAIAAIFVITIVMGAALGVVYSVTKKPIEDANEKAKQEAYREVYPDAAIFTEFDDDTVAKLVGAEEGKGYETLSKAVADSGFASDTIDMVTLASDANGEPLGMIITTTNCDGYGGDIKMVVGLSSDGKVTGLSFLTLNETVGLGMQANEQEFRDKFKINITSVSGFTYTKTGSKQACEIDALSGATITTSAVVDGVNASVRVAVSFISALKGGLF